MPMITPEKIRAIVQESALSKEETRELIDLWDSSITDEEFGQMWAERELVIQ